MAGKRKYKAHSPQVKIKIIETDEEIGKIETLPVMISWALGLFLNHYKRKLVSFKCQDLCLLPTRASVPFFEGSVGFGTRHAGRWKNQSCNWGKRCLRVSEVQKQQEKNGGTGRKEKGEESGMNWKQEDECEDIETDEEEISQLPHQSS
ncbi:dr1-associated corepressor-like [Antechinus flavipes]|uniref:dr1-associated corepressor-like n=1 Tax=Antechinus flavipes TaxID=38775 RepID=UPI0022368A2C|nr:dr1-associated corepressor-like [Antechinus flavipes]